MQDEKTIMEWLETLPEPFKSKALDNASDNLDAMQPTLSAAIYHGFDWKQSPEGFSFWSDCHLRCNQIVAAHE